MVDEDRFEFCQFIQPNVQVNKVKILYSEVIVIADYYSNIILIFKMRQITLHTSKLLEVDPYMLKIYGQNLLVISLDEFSPNTEAIEKYEMFKDYFMLTLIFFVV